MGPGDHQSQRLNHWPSRLWALPDSHSSWRFCARIWRRPRETSCGRTCPRLLSRVVRPTSSRLAFPVIGVKKHPVYRSLNKPLTLLGVERRLFFFLLTVSFLLLRLTGALVPALGLFLMFMLAARWATSFDPQILRVLLNSRRFVARYDPAKWDAGE